MKPTAQVLDFDTFDLRPSQPGKANVHVTQTIGKATWLPMLSNIYRAIESDTWGQVSEIRIAHRFSLDFEQIS